MQVPANAEPAPAPPLPPPAGETLILQTSTPTIAGAALPGANQVQIIDDFRDQPLRIAKRIWNANGVVLTIKVTLFSFVLGVIIGLVFGIMRVSSGSPDLRMGAPRRLLIGLAIIGALLLVRPGWRTPTDGLIIAAVVEAIMFLLPAMPYTLSTLYVEIVRGVPMLVIILYMGFAVTPSLARRHQQPGGLAWFARGRPGAGFWLRRLSGRGFSGRHRVPFPMVRWRPLAPLA